MTKTKFYTGKGDKGLSQMGKERIAKNDPLFRLLGGLDELNSWIGFCRAGITRYNKLKLIGGWLRDAQEALFILQAEVASLGSGFKPKFNISKIETVWLEKVINQIDTELPKITKFVIPGASEVSARIDVARVLARKTERAARTVSSRIKLSADFLQYLNRLSSFLFALARFVNYKLKIKEEHPSYK